MKHISPASRLFFLICALIVYLPLCAQNKSDTGYFRFKLGIQNETYNITEATVTKALFKSVNVLVPRVEEIGAKSYFAEKTTAVEATSAKATTFADDATKGVKTIVPKGFKQTKEFGYQHGQKVYKYKVKYCSKDVDGHNGGVWKVFEEVSGELKRIGTSDENLNILKN